MCEGCAWWRKGSDWVIVWVKQWEREREWDSARERERAIERVGEWERLRGAIRNLWMDWSLKSQTSPHARNQLGKNLNQKITSKNLEWPSLTIRWQYRPGRYVVLLGYEARHFQEALLLKWALLTVLNKDRKTSCFVSGRSARTSLMSRTIESIFW